MKACNRQCQSCGMPLDKDPSGLGGGTEKDGSISTMWCSLCYANGSFVAPTCTLREMQIIVDQAMKQQGFTRFTRMIARNQLPQLARWKQPREKGIRFRRKTYGRGWTPCTRQGRIIVLLYILILVALSYLYLGTENQPPTKEMVTNFIIGMLISTVVLVVISYKKGESPRWQRGNKKA